MKWTENFRMQFHDTDVNGIVRPSSVLGYMQETAFLQMEALGPSIEDLRQSGKAFVLTRFSMGIYSDLHAFDQVSVQSFATESRGYSFNRCARVYKDEKIVAELTSVWALVDIKTKKLFKTTEQILNFGVDEAISLDTPTRINIPKDLRMSLVGERTIRYSDIDRNGHMNNANYPDMLCDYLPGMENKKLVSMSVAFFKEAPWGETEKIYCGSVGDDEYYFRTVKRNGDTGIEAHLIVEEIV